MWIGAAMLAALGLHAMLIWFELDLATCPGTPVDEPWTTLIYLAIAGVLLGYRFHHRRTELELARVRSDASALKLATDAFLVVHDLTNTPLQVLEIALPLLRQRHVGDEAILDSALRAIARLRAVRDQLPLSTVTSASLDPETLRRLRAAFDDERSPR